jgi:hypothetical protein
MAYAAAKLVQARQFACSPSLKHGLIRRDEQVQRLSSSGAGNL